MQKLLRERVSAIETSFEYWRDKIMLKPKQERNQKFFLNLVQGKYFGILSNQNDPLAEKVITTNKQTGKTIEKYWKLYEEIEARIKAMDTEVVKVNGTDIRELKVTFVGSDNTEYLLSMKFSSEHSLDFMNRARTLMEKHRMNELIVFRPYSVEETKTREDGTKYVSFNNGIKFYTPGNSNDVIKGWHNKDNPEPEITKWEWIEDAEGKKKPDKKNQIKYYRDKILRQDIIPYLERLHAVKDELNEIDEEDVF